MDPEGSVTDISMSTDSVLLLHNRRSVLPPESMLRDLIGLRRLQRTTLSFYESSTRRYTGLPTYQPIATMGLREQMQHDNEHALHLSDRPLLA